LPFINDTKENISKLLDYCIEAKVFGILCFGIGLTLREGNREYFYKQLDKLFPGMKEKYIKTYGNEYVINSTNNDELMKFFYQKCKANGIICNNSKIFQYLSSFDEKQTFKQLGLFE
ncbi:MAG: hypothetical protein PHN29_01940, partial [Endomicrobiaceae bacterium]|nr:hypothetical protein [Endomicrobiaceae bacterium]